VYVVYGFAMRFPAARGFDPRAVQVTRSGSAAHCCPFKRAIEGLEVVAREALSPLGGSLDAVGRQPAVDGVDGRVAQSRQRRRARASEGSLEVSIAIRRLNQSANSGPERCVSPLAQPIARKRPPSDGRKAPQRKEKRPALESTNLVRHYSLRGDRLVLSFPLGDNTAHGHFVRAR
jgi:hypothetical protein